MLVFIAYRNNFSSMGNSFDLDIKITYDINRAIINMFFHLKYYLLKAINTPSPDNSLTVWVVCVCFLLSLMLPF